MEFNVTACDSKNNQENKSPLPWIILGATEDNFSIKIFFSLKFVFASKFFFKIIQFYSRCFDSNSGK